MKALVFDGTRVALHERDAPPAQSGHALVRVALAGVCNTDLEIAKGYMGFRGVLGHEFVGRVVEGPDAWRGERIVSEINFACGSCARCRSGLGRHCAVRRVMGILDADGAFAELLSVPIANLHRVPEEIPDEAAVFCEPLAAAHEILEQVEVADQRCVVIGDGKLGLLVAQVLAAAGGRVLAIGHHAEKLAILSRRGIETRLAADWQAGEGDGADVVVEATGSPGGLAQAIAATRPRGKLVLKSTLAERSSVDLAPIVIDEIQIVGSRCGPFEPALEALAEHRIEVASLVDAVLPLARASEAIARAAEPGAGKILIDCR